jgi:small-conductance mechanosensitive channel
MLLRQPDSPAPVLQGSAGVSLFRPNQPLLVLRLALFSLLFAMGARDAEAQARAPVRVGETVVVVLQADRDGQSPLSRASRASAAITATLTDPGEPEVRVEVGEREATVFVGSSAVLELTQEDAIASGESALGPYAGTVSAELRQALTNERRRSRIAESVLSWSLVVFLGLVAFYLIKQVASLAQRARAWLEGHEDQRLTVSVRGIELVQPAVLRSTALVVVSLTRWLGKFVIFYGWLIVVLSLFESTRGYTEQLTGFVLSPLSQLMGRLATALPLLVVAGFAALAVFVLVRFTGLFLRSVERHEIAISWLPADLARPTSALARIAIVLGAVVFGGPLVTGSTEDSLARVGAIAMATLGLAATPLLASALVGTRVLFGRQLFPGEHVRMGQREGVVSAVTLLEIRIRTAEGTEQSIPHLATLWTSLERLGRAPRVWLDLHVSPAQPPAEVLRALERGAGLVASDCRAEVVGIGGGQLHYRVSATLIAFAERSLLVQRVLGELTQAGIAVAELPTTGGAR